MILLLVSCFEAGFIQKFNYMHKYKKPAVLVVQQSGIPDTVLQDTLQDTITLLTPVSEWKGKKFRLLEKTKMFQKYGYELYISPLFSEDSIPADPKIAHANHRINYGPFKGTTITATDVQKLNDGEYVITFQTDTLNLTVYGRTRKGIIEGIALYSDFEEAEKRWKGKTIFSRRRSIETYDSAQSCYNSIKVSITEPLKVVSIRWGITPLPPKSLWLVVESPHGFTGFLPINYSWTNVLKTEDTDNVPWERDIFEKNPREVYKWEDYIWTTIDKHNVCTGMTTEQVLFSWDNPQNRKTVQDSTGMQVTTFTYKGKILVFENDTLRRTEE
jgi:hypothetical protein